MYCSGCGNECDTIVADFGIGSYEYWGNMCSHTDYREVSKCCEADAYDTYLDAIRDMISCDHPLPSIDTAPSELIDEYIDSFYEDGVDWSFKEFLMEVA